MSNHHPARPRPSSPLHPPPNPPISLSLIIHEHPFSPLRPLSPHFDPLLPLHVQSRSSVQSNPLAAFSTITPTTATPPPIPPNFTRKEALVAVPVDPKILEECDTNEERNSAHKKSYPFFIEWNGVPYAARHLTDAEKKLWQQIKRKESERDARDKGMHRQKGQEEKDRKRGIMREVEKEWREDFKSILGEPLDGRAGDGDSAGGLGEEREETILERGARKDKIPPFPAPTPPKTPGPNKGAEET